MAVTVETQKDQLRQKTLEAAKRHKASWIELGQYLHTIYKEKLFRHWGFFAFETYCKKELSIKETTASKLLKSYLFLEKEEPRMASADFSEEETPTGIPHYESINLLRLAKENKKITPSDFADLRRAVLNHGKEPKEIRAQVKKFLSEEETKDPAELRKSRRNWAIKRLVTFLSNTKKALESEALLPAYLLKQIEELSRKLEDQIE